MAKNPTAVAFAQKAVELALRTPPIPYVLGGKTEAGTDCSNLIWLILRALGGSDVRAGSNTIWDEHVRERTFRNDGGGMRFGGMLEPGTLLFIDYADVVNQTPAGTPGKMDHMGIYVGDGTGLMNPEGKPACVVHASSNRGMVCGSTLQNAWTHSAHLIHLDYDSTEDPVDPKGQGSAEAPKDPKGGEAPSRQWREETVRKPNERQSAQRDDRELWGPESPLEPSAGQAKVITTTSGLKLRKLPGKEGATIKEMPMGAIVDVLQLHGLWARVRYIDWRGTPHIGWCCTGENGTEYLRFG